MNKPYESLDILGIKVTKLGDRGVKNEIERALAGKINPIQIATVNPSFIMEAQKNKEFKDILNNKTDINTPDGVGVQMAADYCDLINANNKSDQRRYNRMLKNFLMGIKLGVFDHLINRKPFKNLPDRITGVELTKWLLKLAEKNNYKVLVALTKGGMTSKEELQKYLDNNFDINYKVVEVALGSFDSFKLKNTTCDILFSTLGQFKQEKFILNNKELVNSKVSSGVGSTFDLLSGSLPEYSKAVKGLGLEWLMRLIKKPNRFKKIFNSFPLFPLKLYWESNKS